MNFTLLSLSLYILYSCIQVNSSNANVKTEVAAAVRRATLFEALLKIEPDNAQQIIDHLYSSLSPEQVDGAIKNETELLELIVIAKEVLNKWLGGGPEVVVDGTPIPTYGRLYLENSPLYFQYNQAEFGGFMDYNPREIVLSNPLDACTQLVDGNYEGRYVFVTRGNCSFISKAEMLRSVNASGMIMFNSQDGLFRMTSSHPDVEENDTEINDNLAIPSIMVSHRSGNFIKKVLQRTKQEFGDNNSIKAVVIPQGYFIDTSVSDINPVMTEDEATNHKVQLHPYLGFYSGRFILNNEINQNNFAFMSSEFGGPLLHSTSKYVFLSSEMGCSPIDTSGEVSIKGKVVVLLRGSCTAFDKAQNVENAQGIGLIIISHIPGLSRLGLVENAYTGPSIGVALVQQNSLSYFQARPEGEIAINLTNEFNVTKWNTINQYYLNIQRYWPRDLAGRESTLEHLLTEYNSDELMSEFLHAAHDQANSFYEKQERLKKRRSRRKSEL